MLAGSRIRNVLFDVDGTLYSSEPIIHAVYLEEFSRWQSEHGRPARIPDLAEIVAQIGRPVPAIFAALAPDLEEEARDGLALRVLENLVARVRSGQGDHYAGAADVVRELYRRGLRLFTVSNGRAAYIAAVLEAAAVRSCFEALPDLAGMGAADKTELARSVLERYGLRADQTILVGDRASDRDAAVVNGVDFWACSFGHGTAEEWEGARTVLARPADLLEVLDRPVD